MQGITKRNIKFHKPKSFFNHSLGKEHRSYINHKIFPEYVQVFDQVIRLEHDIIYFGMIVYNQIYHRYWKGTTKRRILRKITCISPRNFQIQEILPAKSVLAFAISDAS